MATHRLSPVFLKVRVTGIEDAERYRRRIMLAIDKLVCDGPEMSCTIKVFHRDLECCN